MVAATVITALAHTSPVLGNVRSVVREDGAVVESNEYYPYGGLFSATPSVQPYKYGAKELDRTHGLDWYDFGARMHDAMLTRWGTIDPFAEKYFNLSPYIYCAANPIKFVDPDGCDGIVCINGSNVLIKSKIFLYGQGATLSVVKQMQQDINTIWGGKHSVKYKNNTYYVSIVATVSLYGNKEQNNPFVILDKFNPFSRNNYIEVSNRVKRSFVRRGDEGKWRSEGRQGISLSEDDSAPHEFGHLLGLDDHYSDVNGKSITDEGWESNIMGNSVSGIVDERNIFDILKEILNKYDEWRNNGNSGEFRYEINP